jgi:predicted amidohydrolase YtcJ
MKNAEYATIAIINANIITMNNKQAKAEAVAIRKNRILAVGTNQQIKKYISTNTKIIDAKNKTVIPGLIDTHVHMSSLGFSLRELNLRNVTSIKQLQEKVKQHSHKLALRKWVIGRGWDQEKFIEKRIPTRWDLDKADAEHPVILIRVCGHVAVTNTKALELAGVTSEKRRIFGEQIDVNEKTGELTGILREKAIELVRKVIPQPSMNELEEICILACREALRNGLTTVHWIVNTPREIEALQRLRRKNRLPLRVYVITPVEFFEYLIDKKFCTGVGDNLLKIGSCKIFSDGSLGARTALLKEPYKDAPNTVGIALYTQKELNRLVMKVHKAGFQVAIHAIGDRAIEMSIKALENIGRKENLKNRRHRIEHVSVLNPKLLMKMKELGVVASIQPHFLISDFWITQRLGRKRASWTYPFRTLIKNDIIVTGGSDSPVEPLNPLLGIWAAVTRRTFKKQRLSLEEALRLYTINAAYASFEENVKGSIEIGKFADLVILSENLSKISREKIKDVKVETTIVDGRIMN